MEGLAARVAAAGREAEGINAEERMFGWPLTKWVFWAGLGVCGCVWSDVEHWARISKPDRTKPLK